MDTYPSYSAALFNQIIYVPYAQSLPRQLIFLFMITFQNTQYVPKLFLAASSVELQVENALKLQIKLNRIKSEQW